MFDSVGGEVPSQQSGAPVHVFGGRLRVALGQLCRQLPRHRSVYGSCHTPWLDHRPWCFGHRFIKKLKFNFLTMPMRIKVTWKRANRSE